MCALYSLQHLPQHACKQTEQDSSCLAEIETEIEEHFTPRDQTETEQRIPWDETEQSFLKVAYLCGSKQGRESCEIYLVSIRVISHLNYPSCPCTTWDEIKRFGLHANINLPMNMQTSKCTLNLHSWNNPEILRMLADEVEENIFKILCQILYYRADRNFTDNDIFP